MEMENLVPRFHGKLLLVTEVAATTFLEEKDKEKRQKYEQSGTHSILSSQPSGVLNVEDIVAQYEARSREEGDGRKKKKKVVKNTPYVRFLLFMRSCGYHYLFLGRTIRF